jgi:cell division protein FtsW
MRWVDQQSMTLRWPDAAVAERSRRGDHTILLLTLLLVAIGLGMIYSASGVLADKRFGAPSYFLKRQLLWCAVGLVALLVVARCDLVTLRRWAVPVLLFGLLCLVLVLLPSIGVAVKGSRRWLRIGALTIQPSEVVKLGVVLYLAHYLAKKGERIGDFWRGFAPPLVVVGLLIALIVAEPDMGTAAVIGLVTLGLLFAGGARLGHLLVIAMTALPVVYLLVMQVGYRRQRLLSFWDPWSDPTGTGFQVIQSFLALGSGGPFGVGLGEGRQKLFYLPEPHTDFVLAALGEELGFVGTAMVLLLLGAFVAKGFSIALETNEPFARNVALGVSLLIGVHVLINVGVVTGLLPTKGLTLPFLSYGGSSLVVCMVGAGLLIGVHRHRPPI